MEERRANEPTEHAQAEVCVTTFSFVSCAYSPRYVHIKTDLEGGGGRGGRGAPINLG